MATPFTPFSAESYGRIGKPAMDLLSKLGEEAEGAGPQCRKAHLVSRTLWKLSVGLCSCNFHMYRASLRLLSGGTGSGFQPGAAVHTEELV
jgi:hypothetical protein